MKYKICKLQNDNGKEWYQVKKRVWLFWFWARESYGPIDPILLVRKFDTFEKAQQWVFEDKKWRTACKNGRQQKIIECIEI